MDGPADLRAGDLRPAAGPGEPNGPVGGGANSAQETSSLKESLSPKEIAAGAGASIVSAILGSFLGAVGTVLGAALGSIVYTLASAFLTRGIEQGKGKALELKDKAAARKGKGVAEGTAVAARQSSGRGAAGPTGEETVRLDPSQAPGRRQRAGSAAGRGGWRRVRPTRKTLIVSAVLGVLTFAVSMFLITGIEVVKGSSLSGNGSGTSLGGVVRPGPPAPATDEGEQSGGTDSSSTSESATSTGESSTESSSESGTSTGESGEQQSEESGSGSDGDSGNRLQDGLNRVLPTQEPDSGQQNSGQDGGGASPTE